MADVSFGKDANSQDINQAIVCARPIADQDINSFFQRSALLQLKLEFGEQAIEIFKLKSMPVGPSLVRVDGFAKLRQPGRKDQSIKRITGWVERCQGVVIIRGNTWLANGDLVVPRYSKAQIPGSGVVLGAPDAPLHLIAFVDSRCPHCHRLIGYAQTLAKQGKIYIEIRQTAFLEEPRQALIDTRFWESPLIKQQANPAEQAVQLEAYLEMLSGLSNEESVPESTPGYAEAMALISSNTATAREVLGLTNVPALLVLDSKEQGLYRLTGYWEMNRLLQPDL